MIPLSYSAILVFFVSVPVLITSGFALYYNLCSLHRPSREKETIYECAECGHVYAFARNRPMDRCPRCDHLNEAVRT
ncbi:MAG: hypothetical protein OEL75_02640 [Kiritimatiellaceae bacterium]|nr:hypothetical protein [Kiritimatiellaceae bacterium]